MEEMPFKLLLVVLLFGFTLSTGLKALERAEETEGEVSARSALNLLAAKLQIVAIGAPGAREGAEFELAGDSRLFLSNERLGDGLRGKVEVEMGGGHKEVEIALLPFWEGGETRTFSRTYLPGKHRITFTHEVEGGQHYISVR